MRCCSCAIRACACLTGQRRVGQEWQGLLIMEGKRQEWRQEQPQQQLEAGMRTRNPADMVPFGKEGAASAFPPALAAPSMARWLQQVSFDAGLGKAGLRIQAWHAGL